MRTVRGTKFEVHLEIYMYFIYMYMQLQAAVSWMALVNISLRVCVKTASHAGAKGCACMAQKGIIHYIVFGLLKTALAHPPFLLYFPPSIRYIPT
jgi:hypothetical protein